LYRGATTGAKGPERMGTGGDFAILTTLTKKNPDGEPRKRGDAIGCSGSNARGVRSVHAQGKKTRISEKNGPGK